MLKSNYLSLLFAGFILVLLSHNYLYAEHGGYKITIKGVNRDFFKGGLKVMEFAELDIKSKTGKNEVDTFEITLARGSRAVDNRKISGDHFNLRKYSGIARSGDRIVIEIHPDSITPSGETTKVIITIPII